VTFRKSFPYPRSEWSRGEHAKRLLAAFPQRIASVMFAVIEALAEAPAPSLRALRSTVRTSLGRCSDGDVDAVVVLLGACIKRTKGSRGATRYALQVSALPRELREELARRQRAALSTEDE